MPRPPQVPRYCYRCQDDSVLAAWISRVVAPHFQRRLPKGITANDVTVAGTLILWLAVAAVLLAPAPLRPLLAPAAVLLLWFYCVLDHVDGLHARLQGTSSPLGEYLDHGLDAWNVGGVVALVAAVAGNGVAPFTVAALLAGLGLAAVGTWLAQREYGEIYLGRLGPVEGVLLAGCFVGSWSLPAVRAWWSVGFTGEWSRADVALLGAAGVAALSALQYGKRVRRLRIRLGALGLQLAAVLVAGAAGWVDWPAIWWVVAAATALYCGRIITSHLAQTPAPWPDFVAIPGVLALAALGRAGGVGSEWQWLPLGWLAAAALMAFGNAWYRFGHYWRPEVPAVAAVQLIGPVPEPEGGRASGG